MDDAPSLPWTVQSKTELAGAKVLLRELGWIGTATLGTRHRLAVLRGEPFRDFDPPDSLEERLSRQQIAPAIVLFRLLRDRYGAERAMAITRDVVIGATLPFLSATIGPITRDAIDAMSAEERESWVKRIARRFFNATARFDHVGTDEVRFTVTACHFVRLCAEVGEPDLARLFCEGDAVFFGSVEPNVRLDRPETLARGDAACAFHLYWVDE